jgi:spoIIIJ-associated protein
MEWVETTGKTVEEAKKLALEQLGVEEVDAEFEVVAEPKIGLFGRLKEEARVRARIQPRYPRSKGERRDRRRSRATANQEQPATATSAAPGPPLSPHDEDTSRPRATRHSRTESGSVRAGDAPLGQADGAAPGSSAPGGAAQSANIQQSNQATGTRRRRRSGGPSTMTDETERDSDVSSEERAEAAAEQARLAESFLRGLLSKLGATATVGSLQQPNGIVEVLIDGDGLGTLIGPKGATLLALQELTRIAVQRQAPPSDCRIIVDINGYRKRRQEALTVFARQVALEVQSSGVRRALEPMPPADRKVVHDAVNGIAGVSTVSQGEEPSRRVVLVPVAAGGTIEPEPGEPQAPAATS